MTRFTGPDVRVTNQQRITLVAFLTYFIMSAMLAPIGIISTPMAEHFGQSVTEVTREFSWLTGSILVGAVIALFVFDWVRLKLVFTVVYTMMALSLLGFTFIDELALVRYLLGMIGMGCGIGLAAAAITISKIYAEDRRASMLVVTDACFSTAGFVVAWTAGYFVARSLGWSLTYQLVGAIAAIIVLLTLFSSFPATTREETSDVDVSDWSLPVWLCVASLFLYTLGQYAVLLWLPSYATSALGATPVQAGNLVGQYWLGMFLAQLFVAWWVLRIGVRNLVGIATLTTLAGTFPVWLYGEIEGLALLTLLWGFGNLAILKAILSFATTLVASPGARLVSLMLLGATLGTAVSPTVTSAIVESSDYRTSLMFGSACYAMLFTLMFIARKLAPVSGKPA